MQRAAKTAWFFVVPVSGRCRRHHGAAYNDFCNDFHPPANNTSSTGIYRHKHIWRTRCGPAPGGRCLLDSCDRGSCIAIDSKQIGTHAGHLASLLKQQLERHLLTKIKTASKQTYPVWHFDQDTSHRLPHSSSYRGTPTGIWRRQAAKQTSLEVLKPLFPARKARSRA